MKQTNKGIPLFIALVALSGLGAAYASEHVVVSGDTLYGLARKYEVSVDQIRQANGFSANSIIKIGQKIKIPLAAKAAPEVPKLATTRTIVVERGDTLFGLARTHGTNITELRSLNNLKPDQSIKIGQKLLVPIPTGVESGQKTVVTVDSSVQNPGAAPTAAAVVASIPEKTTSAVVSQPTGTILEQERLDERHQKTRWPVAGEVYSMGGKFLGVAIKAREGADVSNLIDGKVIYTGPHSTLGTVVFVQGDNGYIYVYGGNELSLVKTGAVVKSGEVIARLGKGTVMGSAQAFFTVWKNGNYIDPVEAPRT